MAHQKEPAAAAQSGSASGDVSVGSSAKKKRSGKNKENQGPHQEAWQLLLAESWKKASVNRKDQQKQNAASSRDDDAQSSGQKTVEAAKDKGGGNKGWFGGWGTGSSSKKGEKGEEEGDDAPIGGASSSSELKLPDTFPDMVVFNCRMMGSVSNWISIVLEKFDKLVTCVVLGQEAYLEQEANFLALRFHKEETGKIVLKEFRVAMLASMRSLNGNEWTVEHEEAWSKMWGTVEAKLAPALPLPVKYEVRCMRLLDQMTAERKREFGMAVFNRLFEKIPATETYFKQNNERLRFIVTKAIEMSTELYRDPKRLIIEIQDLGLRHIMYNVATEFFEPFILCMLEELEVASKDEVALEGFAWALTQIASTMVRVIDEGATPLIRAVLANKPKQVRKALAGYSREERAAAQL